MTSESENKCCGLLIEATGSKNWPFSLEDGDCSGLIDEDKLECSIGVSIIGGRWKVVFCDARGVSGREGSSKSDGPRSGSAAAIIVIQVKSQNCQGATLEEHAQK